MARIALHVYPSSLEYESRIFKMAQTQITTGLFDKVYIIGIHNEGLAEHEALAPGIELHRIKLTWRRVIPGLKSLIFYLEWYHRIFWYYIKLNPVVVQCHSLSALFLCVLIKWRTHCKLIYDAHELETERFGLTGLHKIGSKYLEYVLIKHVNTVLVVSPSIEEWYKKEYPGVKVVCIRNVPYKLNIDSVDKNYFRKLYNIGEGEPIYIYAGVLNYGRSIPALLDVFQLHPDKHIVFMGYGVLESEIKRFGEKYANIHLHKAVPSTEVSIYCAAADVGIVLSENICLSYYYGYANKMFEYVQAGCAVIASNFPDMGGFVTSNNCGWACAPNANAIENLINTLTPEKIEAAKANNCEIRNNYTWETEQELYKKALENA